MYGSPTVARPLLYILEIIQNTIPHIFHANEFSLTVCLHVFPVISITHVVYTQSYA